MRFTYDSVGSLLFQKASNQIAGKRKRMNRKDRKGGAPVFLHV